MVFILNSETDVKDGCAGGLEKGTKLGGKQMKKKKKSSGREGRVGMMKVI